MSIATSAEAALEHDASTAAGSEAAGEATSPPHAAPENPLAGLLTVAIDGVASMAADFVREHLSRLVHPTPKVSAQDESIHDGAKAATHPNRDESEHRAKGLLVAVAVAAIATAIIWHHREK